MIDFATLKGVTIPEGVVTQIESGGVVLWKLNTGGAPIVLEVEKITSDTYAGETTYTGEQFILLDIYPKTNGTVKVTYGDLTKTITDTSGAEEPNAQQVFFGTFNGVSDSVETPANGTLTIEGDCAAFGEGYFSKAKIAGNTYCRATKEVVSFGMVSKIPANAFGALEVSGTSMAANKKLTNVTIPASVTEIHNYAFCDCTSLVNVSLLSNIPPALGTPGDSPLSSTVFYNTTCAFTVPRGCGDIYRGASDWEVYIDRIVEVS